MYTHVHKCKPSQYSHPFAPKHKHHHKRLLQYGNFSSNDNILPAVELALTVQVRILYDVGMCTPWKILSEYGD